MSPETLSLSRRSLLKTLPILPNLLTGENAAEELRLQKALAAAQLPTVVTISVGPQWESLPKGNTPPRPGATVAQVALAFDKLHRRFGSVAAVTFPTMVVLNTAPGAPNPYDDMPFSDLLPLFAASLSESQYNQLTSAAGLSIGSLNGDTKMMAMQLFPDGKFQAVPWSAFPVHEASNKGLDLSDQIEQTRLRLKQTMEVMLPAAAGPGNFGGVNTPPETENALSLVQRRDYGGAQEKVFGQTVRATVPNEPKPGNLNLRQSVLQIPIGLEKIGTVGELIKKIAKASGIELYADARWNHKTLQVLLPTGIHSAIAADLLRAVALCLSATFRQVGPAYVMTDDLMGYGTRRLLWYEFEKDADALREKPVAASRNALWERYHDRKLSGHGDPAALTDAQTKFDWNQAGDKKSSDNTFGRPIGDFTPEQQARIRQITKIFKDMYKTSEVKEDGNYLLFEAVSLQLIVPSMAQPIETGIQVGSSGLIEKPESVRAAENAANQETQLFEMFDKNPDAIKGFAANPQGWNDFQDRYPEIAKHLVAKYPHLGAIPLRVKTISKPPTAAEISLFWKDTPRRAVRLYPKTASEVAVEINAAKEIGANEVWLSVFQNGGFRADIFETAVREAKDRQLSLMPMFDMLDGGLKAPIALCDRNIFNETTRQARARIEKRQSLSNPQSRRMENEIERLPLGDALSPGASAVQKEIVQAAKHLMDGKATVGHVVLSGISLPGYETSENYSDRAVGLELGYHLDMRLAFLRAQGADPIDLYDPGYYSGKANTDITNYQYDESITSEVSAKWKNFRRETLATLLKSVHQAAKPLPVWVEMPTNQQNTLHFPSSAAFLVQSRYLPWLDPTKPLPIYTPTNGMESIGIEYDSFVQNRRWLEKILTSVPPKSTDPKAPPFKKPTFVLIDMAGGSLARQLPKEN